MSTDKTEKAQPDEAQPTGTPPGEAEVREPDVAPATDRVDEAVAEASPPEGDRPADPSPVREIPGMREPTIDELEDAFDDAWDEPPAPRGVTMRNPILLLAVLAGSVFMFAKYWPRVAYMIDARTPADCGKIHERPQLKADGQPVPELAHDQYCTAQGLVQNFTILATGEPREHADPARRNEGRKYYVKLDGDRVFVVLAADRKDVIKFRARRGSLLGFEVKEPGRMIDPDADALYAETGRKLRLHFSIPETDTVRIFDTTDTPGSRWPAAVGCVFLLLTGLLALFGLIRMIRSMVASRETA